MNISYRRASEWPVFKGRPWYFLCCVDLVVNLKALDLRDLLCYYLMAICLYIYRFSGKHGFDFEAVIKLFGPLAKTKIIGGVFRGKRSS